MTRITRIDHVAMTVTDIDTIRNFYDNIFGVEIRRTTEIDGKLLQQRFAVGGATLSLHRHNNGFDLIAGSPMPGSADICLGWSGTIGEVVELLNRKGIKIVDGPSPRQTTEMLPGQSVYFRDPDQNLIEIMATD